MTGWFDMRRIGRFSDQMIFDRPPLDILDFISSFRHMSNEMIEWKEEMPGGGLCSK